MRLRVFSIVIVFVFSKLSFAQYRLSGNIFSAKDSMPLSEVQVYNFRLNKSTFSDKKGAFYFKNISSSKHHFRIYKFKYKVLDTIVDVNENLSIDFFLSPLKEELSEVIIKDSLTKKTIIRHLKKVEGTAIYAGKKTEVVDISSLVANFSTNNARQIYSQIEGLNIYEADDAGLQLNIGGRGLNPNRTQNFNTRQNDYDISADVLGYPESYYTPPSEALDFIQILRGAASLQYGTQFGGLINFVFKKPSENKKLEIISRNTGGSYGLFTTFNSLSGTAGKFSYYTFYNHKRGDGFRPNSGYHSNNFFAHLGWKFSSASDLSFEYTHLNYLAQQAGGLTDKSFYEDPFTSNRSRNWFEVDWNLYNLKFRHSFSEQSDFSLNIFGLKASRAALGFRQNRVSQADDLDAPRELLIDQFNNYGAEARFLKHYSVKNLPAVLLVGSKFYQASNQQEQGPGSKSSNADFNFYNQEFPYYRRQSKFNFPNTNMAFFGENIFTINQKLSVTPGFRVEYIKTTSIGSYKKLLFNLAEEPILNQNIEDNRDLERQFILLGIGIDYKATKATNLYLNFSQNYRSVTYNDIRIINPVFQVDPKIRDEKGFTADLGFRSKLKDKLYFDANVFGLLYSDRIGQILKLDTNDQNQTTGRIIRYRGNIGNALIYGLETLLNWDVKQSFFSHSKNCKLSLFLNTSFTKSRYLDSEEVSVKGNEVEFIPFVNLKTGLHFGYNNFLASLQYTYLSEQFSDASNTPQNKNENQRGIEGMIPSYGVADLSMSYTFKFLKVQSGVNNLLNQLYFTRRATGYPGPGIIPSAPISWYVGLELKF